MKIKADKLSPLIKGMKSTLESVPLDEGGGDMKAYYLEDVTLIMDGAKFYGLTVNVIERPFHVMGNLEVVFEEEGDEENLFVVEDEELMSFISDYLVIRNRLFEGIGA